MRVMFAVQGEGRGHLTQAMAAAEILRQTGHHLAAVVVGGDSNRSLPPYFESSLTVPLIRVRSPGFVFRNGRGVCAFGTVRRLLFHLAGYRESLLTLDRVIDEVRPDLIINFLEPLVGLRALLRSGDVPVLAVGHQFMLGHPAFVRTRRHWFQQFFMRRYVDVVGARSTRLALSFYPAADLPDRGLLVSPPLLRSDLFQKEPVGGDYLLIYLLNHGYATDILNWHQRHPSVPIHCFYDKPGAPPAEAVTPNLTFHQLDGARFLQLMAGARGVVCTAGFESVCEAAYLGKRTLLVPVENHVEQMLNALDAARAGLAIHDQRFALDRLLDLPAPDGTVPFRRWARQAGASMERAIRQAVRWRPTTPAVPVPPPFPAARLARALEGGGSRGRKSTRVGPVAGPIR